MNFIKQLAKSVLILFVLTTLSTQAHAFKSSKKILMIVSSHGLQQGAEQPGYEFDEFAKAYNIFKQNGIEVEVASPKGGKVEADKFDPTKPYNANVLADKAIMAKLDNTIATTAIEPDSYDALFIVGGKGAMFDLPKDQALQSMIAKVYQQQGSIAAVCHGPAALVDVKLSDGRYLVSGKAVNSFTNQEEQLFGKKWLAQYPFLLQDKLIERGAKFQSSDIMLNHVAIDERLITGQNPTSTAGVANELVKQLGIKPVSLPQTQEDKTLAVIAQLLAGDQSAASRLSRNEQEYHIALAGMYGFYYQQVAETQQQKENALTLMVLAQKAINNPKLDMQIAKAQQQLGQTTKAKRTLVQLLEVHSDYKPALDMLETLSL